MNRDGCVVGPRCVPWGEECPSGGALGAVPGVQLAKIVWPGGEYQLTLEDVLWMGRMASCEGDAHWEDRDAGLGASLWTLTQRFVAAGGTGTLAGLAKAFSQCINPRWASGGDLCVAHPARCTQTQQSRRQASATVPWEQLPEPVKQTTLLWATARFANPVPRATNFAAAASSQRCLDRGSCSRVVLAAGNWYMSTPASERWTADHVTMQLGDRVAGPETSLWGLVAGLALAGAALYASSRLGRSGELGYPPQPCGLEYDDFRSGWRYGDAYEFIAFRPESKGTSQRAVLREMKKLKQAEYERYLEDCAGGPAPDFKVDPADYQD